MALKPSEAKKARAAARQRYESTLMTLGQVAEELGVSKRSVERWSSQGKWRKVEGQHVGQKAQAIADRQRVAIEQLGEGATIEEKRQVVEALTEDAAAGERAALLVRHRKEWNIPRALMQEAVQARNFDSMKKAKITAETLTIVQSGERKAWGLDTEQGTKVQVIIERD